MGYMTKLIRRLVLHFLTLLTCNTDLLPEEARASSVTAPPSSRSSSAAAGDDPQVNMPANNTSTTHLLRRMTAKSFSLDPNAPDFVFVIIYISILYDALDLVNAIVDIIFVARLLAEEDAAYYAVLLLVGLIVGRVVDFRGTTLLFRDGVNWHPFWIKPRVNSYSLKNQRVLAVLYCLVFTEAAIFLLEDYPALVIYSHWMVVAFPPPFLEALDNINVAMSAVSLSVLGLLFVIVVVGSLALLLESNWKHWNWFMRLINGTKIIIFLSASVFLAIYTIQMVISASKIVFKRERTLPSNTIIGIPVCDDTTFEERREFCDEQVFVIRVGLAWVAAGIFTGYLIFRPADFESIRNAEINTTTSAIAATPASQARNNQNNDRGRSMPE
ncbi:hypothetical protein ACA910_018318 [Epithemia clementina (nom. ined.)]